MANGGSTIEVDEESHSRQGTSGTPIAKDCGEDSTSCLRTLKLTDTLEAAEAVQRSHRMEKRPSHMMTNAERESERSLREP